MSKILIIDDDDEVRQIMARSFKERGHVVVAANSAETGLRCVKQSAPDCVLLDVMLPGIDGLQAFEKIREITSAPIIFLTGLAAEEDKIKGLLLGADDYIVKPYSFRELEARITAAVMRSKPQEASSPQRLSFPPLELDIVAHSAYCHNQNLNLTVREYDLLHLLATSGGKIVTYEEIAARLWGTYQPEDRSTVMVSVSRLRKKLEADLVAANMIETVWAKGYKFVGRRRKE